MIHLQNVTYTYPHAQQTALQDISLTVEPGQLVLCTGPSGCGKSTLINIINGLIPHYLQGTLEGEVTVDRVPTRQSTPDELASRVGTLFQNPDRQFFALTVADEMAVALQWRGWSPEKTNEAVMEAAERMGIISLLGQTIFGLSDGQKQKVAIASLLATKPAALVLDEPSANLDPESTLELAQILISLKNDGLAIFVVDHRLAWLRNIADTLLVLQESKNIRQVEFSTLDDDHFRISHGLRAARVEDGRDNLVEMDIPSPEENIFGCQNLHFGYTKEFTIFSGAAFAFRAGEIIALIGKNGVGKTTLARLFTGLEKSKFGDFSSKRTPIPTRSLVKYAQVVLQNAGHQLRMRTVGAELADAALSTFTPTGGAADVQKCLEEYGLSHLKDRHPQSLSGGEKQRLAIACATIRSPAMLILDEPTSGLDGLNMERIAVNVRQAAQNGSAVVVITHDLELMNAVCTKKLTLPLSSTACA